MTAGEAGDEPQPHGRADEGDTTGDHVEGDGVRHREARGSQDLGRVVHGGVDTGDLVSQAQDDTDDQQVTGPPGVPDLAQAPLLLTGLLATYLQHLVDLVDDGAVLGLVTHALEGADGLGDPEVGDVPS